jgi:putative phosphoesterase
MWASNVSRSGSRDCIGERPGETAQAAGQAAAQAGATGQARAAAPAAPAPPGSLSHAESAGSLMRIGVIADTHGLLRHAVFEVFAEVDHILHAGDVGRPELLTELEALAPVTAVFGNTDGPAIRRRCPQVARLEFDGLVVAVTHGDQLGSPTPAALHRAFPDADVIVYGHTHRPLLELVDRTVTVMNPGAAGPRRFDVIPSVGIMETEAGLPPRARLVPLDE